MAHECMPHSTRRRVAQSKKSTNRRAKSSLADVGSSERWLVLGGWQYGLTAPKESPKMGRKLIEKVLRKRRSDRRMSYCGCYVRLLFVAAGAWAALAYLCLTLSMNWRGLRHPFQVRLM